MLPVKEVQLQQTVFYASVAAWLIFLAATDIINREISNWVTLPSLAIGVLYACLSRLELVPLVLAVIFLMLSEVPWAASVVIAMPMLFVFPDYEAMIVGFCVAVVMWKARVIGGADAKVLMTLSMLVPDMRMILFVISGWLLVDLARLVYRFVRHRQQEGIPIPALPAIASGGVVYCMLMLIR
jgi:Flp pilus assembly protein protease CpaA